MAIQFGSDAYIVVGKFNGKYVYYGAFSNFADANNRLKEMEVKRLDFIKQRNDWNESQKDIDWEDRTYHSAMWAEAEDVFGDRVLGTHLDNIHLTIETISVIS
jgi:hypothetical protein